jgi:hypothetical protein
MTPVSPAPLSARVDEGGRLIALRAHYELRTDSSDPRVCIREARTAHGADMLPAHVEGWRLTHDLLGDAAPRFAEFDGARIRTELIPGRPLHEHYAARLRGEDVEPLPWPSLWAGLTRLYESGRTGPVNPKLIPEMAWATWFSIVRLRDAKRHSLVDAWRRPSWSIAAVAALAAGKAKGGFAKPPAVTYEIAAASRSALTLGDMHMANLVGSADRIAFVDFSEAAQGSIALELAPLWMEWWLAQGLVHGDDGFLEGFAEMWRRFVGAESLLVRMSSEFANRRFSWMLFAFYFDHLGLSRARATAAVERADARLAELSGRFAGCSSLPQLVPDLL